MKKYPALAPKTAFDNKTGLNTWLTSWQTEAKYWKVACLFSLLAMIITVSGMLYQSTQHEVIPYIIQVDTNKGAIKGVTSIAQVYQPTDAIIEFFISDFVRKIRSISTDPVVVKRNFLKAYDFVTPKGKTVLTQYCRQYAPLEQVKKEETCIVNILNTIKHSDHSYQVNWNEERFNSNGISQGSSRFSGIFKVIILKPKTDTQIRKNPYSLYIDFFNVSKEQALK